VAPDNARRWNHGRRPPGEGLNWVPLSGARLRPASSCRFQTQLRPLHARLARTPFERIRLLRRFPVVEIQETAQSLPARDTPTIWANVLVWNNQLTGKPLMMPLVMIMRSELLNGVA
jgi:hypothetical protein